MATRKNLGDPWVLEVQQWLNKHLEAIQTTVL